MSRFASTDLAGLAVLAQKRDREIRPALLRLQACAYAAAQTHDRLARETFEALACGLLPLVADSVVADVAAILAGIGDVPAPVRRLLDARLAPVAADPVGLARSASLGRAAIADLLASDRRDVDHALAGNAAIALDARAIALLVERALTDAPLATLLLARAEPGLLDRAALYIFADRPARAAIRAGLARHAGLAAPRLPRPNAARRAKLVALALRGNGKMLATAIGTALAAAPAPAWRSDDEAGREMLWLALGLLGFEDGDRRALLRGVSPGLDTAETERLSAIAATSAVSGLLVGVGTKPKAARKPRKVASGPRPAAAEGPRALSGATAPPARDREEGVRPDRRSRSTTGRDRN